MALMITMNEFILDQPLQTSVSIYHLNQAVRLVNQRLQTPEALSNSHLSVVNFLVFQGLLKEDKQVAEIHLKGLYRMLELRGSLEELEEYPILASKFCK
jgi:hypothetical protein